MPRFDHPELTIDPVGVPMPPAAPIPELTEPADQPLVLDPVHEPLVPVSHPRISVVGVYHHAGWINALPGAWLRAGAYDRLVTAVEELPDEFGFAVFDAWRPLVLQAEIYQAAYADPGLPPGFVAAPSADAQRPPPHLTGGTVDLSLTHCGNALALGTGFDDFTPLAATRALEGAPGPSRDLRRLLYWTMHDLGFVVLEQEWWHFEFGTRRWAAIADRRPLYGPVHR